MRPVSGQASLEYVGAVALLAALVALAVPLAGRAPLAEAVASGIKRGLCIVTGGVCSAREAKALGLEPCTLREDAKGERNAATVAVFRVSNRFNWVLARRSDGTVVVTHSDDTDLGGGLSASILGVELGGSVSGGIHEGAVWEFEDLEAARRFVLMRVRSPQEAARRHPPTYRYESLAGRAEGGIPGAGADLGAAVGRRRGRGRETWFVRTRIDDPSPFAALVPGLDTLRRWQDITVEHTRDSTGPRELAFRLTGAGERPGTVVRVTGRLDLRDPRNARVAAALLDLRAPWPPHVLDGLRRAVGRTLEAGTVEAELLQVETSSDGFDASLPVVRVLGLAHARHRATARLLAARAWVDGVPREREDCPGAP